MRQLFIFLLITFVLSSIASEPFIIFKENKGQWPNKVLFGSEFLNTKFYVNKNSFNYCVYNHKDLEKAHEDHHSPDKNSIIHGHNYEVSFVGGNLSQFIKKDTLTEYFNYFLGNDKKNWASHVKAFKTIEFKEVYKGIDLNIYSNTLDLKYDFILAPNTDPSLIKLNYNYVDGLEIHNNELIIKTSAGVIIEKAPLTYQIINGQKKEVKCNYVLLKDRTIGFEFPNGYEKNIELVIDPVVVVCSYSGASSDCLNSTCTYDDLGNIYVVGWGNVGYPISSGAFQTIYQKDYDFVLSSFNPIGSTKLFSTYLGGDSLDFPFDISVKKNEIIILGQTSSKNFPFTKTAFDTTSNGSYDFVVSKLNITGTSLLASTYIGGLGNDGVYGTIFQGELLRNAEMVCDNNGNVYVISSTNSSNFPVSLGAISINLKGSVDACVFKLNNTLSSLLFSTYLGGSGTELGKSIRLDNTGGVYCFGNTKSSDFPVTAGCYLSTKNGSPAFQDMFISHVNSAGTSLIASTYIGTNSNDFASLMDIDINGDVYICGNYFAPSSFIPTAGIYSNPNGYNAIYKVNSSLSSLIYKTKFGNNPPSNGYPYLYFTAFKVDSCQNIYIAGWGDDSYPTTPNKFQVFGGVSDMYIAKFNSNCSSLSFGSYFGGSAISSQVGANIGEHCDGGISHFDDKGVLYLAICSVGGLPISSNAFGQTFFNSSTTQYNDAFLKVDLQSFVNASSSYGANLIGCPPFTGNFNSFANTGTLVWNFGDGSPLSYLNNETHTYNNLGNYNVSLVVTDTTTCNKIDSIKTLLSVIPPTGFDLGEDKPMCISDKILLQSNVGAVSYLWSTGEITPNIYVNHIGTYQLIINNGGCDSQDQVNVVIGEGDLKEIFPNIVTPNNDGINDFIDLGIYKFNELEFIVYDRWGRQMYQSNSVLDKWNPSDYSDGTYFYLISYRSECTGEYKKNKGYVTLIK